MSFSADDRRLMQRALTLAERGLYTTHPHPRVGCVIARDGQIVGEGFHRRTGEAHAEVNAIADAADAARGATAYVTLEPCRHVGRTGPCTDALIAAGIARVIVATTDPDPRMCGAGLDALARAGVTVSHGLLADEARALNVGYVSRIERKRPWLRAKLAMSLDGKTALANGESKWITGEPARQDVQRFRARSDAVVTGVDTVLADDPQLNVRPAAFAASERERLGAAPRQPLRVVMDSRLRTPASAQMFDGNPVWVATCADRESSYPAGVEIVRLSECDGRVSPHDLLTRLADAGINEAWLECGPRLAGSFLTCALVDELIVYCAPKLLGHQARPLLAIDELAHIDDAPQLEFVDVQRIGTDLRITARPQSTAS